MATYYIDSETGKPENDGLTLKTAWDRLYPRALEPGNVIRIKTYPHLARSFTLEGRKPIPPPQDFTGIFGTVMYDGKTGNWYSLEEGLR